MDSDPAPISEEGGGGRGEIEGEKKAIRLLARCGFSIALSLGLSFLFFFSIGNFTANPPVSLPALCRILSSSVDIKSSKVCELGLFNYKAKHVLYPMSKGKKRFRCHDDYYWASVFEVEYKEYFSGQVHNAVAEAPKEALPHDCRPSFSLALSTKMKFKVNETYNCKYMLGSSKADIYSDNLFNCQAKDPSTVEMLKRYIVLLMQTSFFDEVKSALKLKYLFSGAASGILCGLLGSFFFRSFQLIVIAIGKCWENWKNEIRAYAVRLCLTVAYFSVAGWLILEYGHNPLERVINEAKSQGENYMTNCAVREGGVVCS